WLAGTIEASPAGRDRSRYAATNLGTVAKVPRRRRDCNPTAGIAAGRQAPTASVTHFLVKLALAAPASFLLAADVSHAFCASLSHFFRKLLSAAPASFFSVACALQVGACAKAPPTRPPANRTISPTNMNIRIALLLLLTSSIAVTRSSEPVRCESHR